MKIPKWDTILKDKLEKYEARNLIDFAKSEINEWEDFIKEVKKRIK